MFDRTCGWNKDNTAANVRSMLSNRLYRRATGGVGRSQNQADSRPIGVTETLHRRFKALYSFSSSCNLPNITDGWDNWTR